MSASGPAALARATGQDATSVLSRVTDAQFREVRDLAYRTFGLDLKEGKEALVSARLGKRVSELGLGTIGEYLELLNGDRTGRELTSLIDVLTTNYTSFQREPQHFDLLRKQILPGIAAAHGRTGIWSAGCSTGAEPYTILMHAAEVLGEQSMPKLRLLATDISTRALEKAKAAVYPAEWLRDMPEQWRKQFLQRGVGQQEGWFRVRSELAARVEFARLNLMDRFDHVGQFRVIFCRNVMIYFDKPTQERLVSKFAAQLEPRGWLLIGHSEGLMGVRNELEYVMPAVYRKPA
ncbi:MAG TPA: protein-glutamate O-methyltransferase CheR [Bryobacteraceae bacterium]|nr:protein-glutamate O-methyltransferase CheR [Bryobacteraceae bacterium]